MELPAGWSRIAPPPSIGVTVMLEDGRIMCVVECGTSAIYDPTADRWTATGPHVSTAVRSRGVAVTAEGWVHLSGGIRDGTTDAVADCELYDPKIDAWHVMPPLPTAMFLHAVVAARGRVFAIGGNASGRKLATFLSWAPGEAWKRMPELPEPYDALRACVLDDDSIVVWGSETLRWDHTKWSLIGPIDTGASVVPMPGGFYAIGGTDAGAVVREWTPRYGWQPGPTLPRYQKRPCVVRLRDGRLAVIGGRQTMTRWDLRRVKEHYDVPIAEVILQRGSAWTTARAPEIMENRAHVLPDGRVIVGHYVWNPPVD